MPPRRSLAKRSRSRSPEPESKEQAHGPAEVADEEKLPALATISESEIAEANAAFGAELESGPSVWMSAEPQATALVPVLPGSGGGQLALSPTSTSASKDDISHQLAHLFGCSNVYWRDVDLDKRKLWAKNSGTPYDGTQFVSLTTQPWLNQRFNNERLQGLHVLMPICPLAQCWLLPYGNIDEVNSKFPLKHKEQATVKFSIRPTAYNSFTQTDDGAMDAVSLSAFAWFGGVLEVRIRQAMDASLGTAQMEWSTITLAKQDATSIALHTGYPLFRAPREEDEEALTQLEAKTFKGGYTQQLNSICQAKGKLMNNLVKAYRVTTQAERDAGGPLLEALGWEQQTKLQPNEDEVMLLLGVKAQVKDEAYHARVALAGLIWFGPSSAYSGMRENTVAEKLRLVPPFPKAPSKEELWSRKDAKQEKAKFEARLAKLTGDAGDD
jgi:hypothetical protein